MIHSSMNLEARMIRDPGLPKYSFMAARYWRAPSRTAFHKAAGEDSPPFFEDGRNFQRHHMPRVMKARRSQYISWLALKRPRFSTHIPPTSGKKRIAGARFAICSTV